MKKHQHLIYSLALVAALAGCQQESEEAAEKQLASEATASEVVTKEVEVSKVEKTEVRKKHNPIDDHTYGNLHEVDLKHLDLDLTVDFEEKSLKGFVDLSFDRLKDDVSELILDTRDIDVSKVELNKNAQWIAGDFELAEKDEVWALS